MHPHLSHRSIGRLTATAAATAAAGCVAFTAARADAGLMVDLRAVTVNGVPVVDSNGKQVVAGYGDVVGIDVYVVVTGTNTLNDEALQDLGGSFRSTGGMRGDLSSALLAPFNAIGSQPGLPVDADSDGDFDIGPAPTATGPVAATQFFHVRSDTMTEGGVPVSSAAEEFRVMALTFTAMENGPPTSVEFLRRLNPNGTNNLAYGVWKEDGGVRNATNTPITTSGVQIGIPEPAGVTLSGLAGLGLLARRRENVDRG
jgi:hypothetical protein